MVMLPTPNTSHVSYDRIYEPAEDSFLLLDTLSSATEADYLRDRFDSTRNNAPPVVLEVGPGSGVVLAFTVANAKHIFGRTDLVALGCDINHYACEAATETVNRAVKDAAMTTASYHVSKSSGLFLDVLNGDLSSCFMPHSIDVLIFNPPYVPSELPDLKKHDHYNNISRAQLTSSEAFDRDSHMLALSYAGGADGMEVTDKLLDQLDTVLSRDRGVAYILLCAQNKPEKVRDRLRNWPGSWLVDIVASSGAKAGWEKLCILRICRGPVLGV